MRQRLVILIKPESPIPITGICNPRVLTKKMVSESGITFPKGTVIPVKHCAYRKRFDWEFAMDISVELEVAEDVSADEYGFSLLEVDE